MTNAKSGLDAGLYRDETAEYLVTDHGSNRDLCFVSKAGVTPSIEIVVSGNDTPLSVSVVGSDVTVHSATNGSGQATSTASQIKAAIEANINASALWAVRIPPGQDGSGVTGELLHTHAAEGVAFTSISLADLGDHLQYPGSIWKQVLGQEQGSDSLCGRQPGDIRSA